jgi:serine/threonine protein kinase
MTSAEFSCIIDRMIRYDFRQRYTSASEVLIDLRKLGKIHHLAPKTTQGVNPQGQSCSSREILANKNLVCLWDNWFNSWCLSGF